MARKIGIIKGRQRPPNLLILGASGNVARALLRRLGGRREDFGRLVLLDKNDHVREDRSLEHHRLNYQFVRRRLQFPADGGYYQRLLRAHRIGIVLDLTDMDTLPVLAATDGAGVSYIATSLNDAKRSAAELVGALFPTRESPRKAPHILCSGMNPGAVNIWVLHAVRRYGVPNEIIHFEYDTSMAADGWRPLITWSRRQFLTETAWEPTGMVVDGKTVILRTNALHHREDLRRVLCLLGPIASGE